MPNRCEECGRLASRLANHRSYERRNQPRPGKRPGPAPGTVRRSPLSNTEIAARIKAIRREQTPPEVSRDLQHTCEFCASYGYKTCTNIRICELDAIGEPCRWSPAYRTQDEEDLVGATHASPSGA